MWVIYIFQKSCMIAEPELQARPSNQSTCLSQIDDKPKPT